MMGRLVRRFAVAAVLLGSLGCSRAEPQKLVVTDFGFPWSEKPAPRTEFRAWTDGGRLHFRFDIDDDDLIVSESWDGESTVDGEDRVEFFVARDPGLASYWCIEIDPLGRVHDYQAQHYRQFDSSWDCPGLTTEAARTPTGYTVLGSLPLATLSEWMGRPIGGGSALRVGLFRADFFGTTVATRGEANDNWISWVRPTSSKPDFHVPEAFATIVLP